VDFNDVVFSVETVRYRISQKSDCCSMDNNNITVELTVAVVVMHRISQKVLFTIDNE